MNDDGFWAELEVEPTAAGMFRAVLLMGDAGASGEDALRVPLAGEHPTEREAIEAARAAIKAMAHGQGNSA